MIFCLTPNNIVEEEEDSLDEQSELGDAADEDMLGSSVDEAFEEIVSGGADEPVADDWIDSDEDLIDSLSEDFDTVSVFEDHQSWRLNVSTTYFASDSPPLDRKEDTIFIICRTLRAFASE